MDLTLRSVLCRFLDDGPGDNPWWIGFRLGAVQANALASPIGLMLVQDSRPLAAVMAFGTAFGWAGWARRGFRWNYRQPLPCSELDGCCTTHSPCWRDNDRDGADCLGWPCPVGGAG